MTHEMCSHYTVDGSAYCDFCRDEWYLDTPITFNNLDYKVWAYYGTDESGKVSYSCRLNSGMGAVYLTTEDIDNAIGQVPYWAPQEFHNEY